MVSRLNEIKKFSTWVNRAIAPTVTVCKRYIGMDTFGYRRFLPNGKSFGFSDNIVLNHILLNQFTGIPIPQYEKDFQKFIISGQNYIVREGVPPENNLFLKMLYENNIWNTLAVYVKNLDTFSVEAFFLSAKRDDIHMTELYTKKRSFIHQWIKLIQLQLQEYITPKTDTYFATTLSDATCLRNFQDFLNKEKNKLSVKDLMSLSRREKEIVSLLIKGYKRKDIAVKLGIAPKTVDANIEHIKNKTHAVDKSELLSFLREPFIEEILHDY